MKYPWLYVGAKVVCVDDRRVASENAETIRMRPNMPVAGHTYTVRGVAPCSSPYMPSGVEIRLEEIRNPVACWKQGFGEAGFGVSRFRPVLPDTTKQVEEMKRLMRDHVANASGGMGIRKREKV